MTTILRDDITHLASLCALELSQDEVEALRIDIEHIIEYIDLLGELDTEGVEPTYQVTGLSNVWREDTIEQSVRPAELVGLAQLSYNQSVKVPKVL